MNLVVLMGRLAKEPELRRTNSGTAVASFTVAVNRRSKDDPADFIDCVAWRNTAEFVAKYFGRGQMIAVTGRLQIRDWKDKDGNKRRSYEVVAENVEFCGSKKERQLDDYDGVGASEYEELTEEDGDLPFD